MKKLLTFFQLYGISPKRVRGEEKGRVRERREHRLGGFVGMNIVEKIGDNFGLESVHL